MFNIKMGYKISRCSFIYFFYSTALKNIAVGGTVVYSTCSLSPIQNDGVVKMALKKIWEETNHQIVIKYVYFVLCK